MSENVLRPLLSTQPVDYVCFSKAIISREQGRGPSHIAGLLPIQCAPDCETFFPANMQNTGQPTWNLSCVGTDSTIVVVSVCEFESISHAISSMTVGQGNSNAHAPPPSSTGPGSRKNSSKILEISAEAMSHDIPEHSDTMNLIGEFTNATSYSSWRNARFSLHS